MDDPGSSDSSSSRISDDEEFSNSEFSGNSDESSDDYLGPEKFQSGIPIISREEITTVSQGILVPIPEDIDEVR